MNRLPEVETAKQLMNEAMKWSVMTWLREKKRVRKTADQANAALDRLSEILKQRWPNTIRANYENLASENCASKTNPRTRDKATARESADCLMARKLREADNEALRARMLAEETFDEAERKLSTSLAREGCRKAIQAWELQEKAIVQSEKCAV